MLPWMDTLAGLNVLFVMAAESEYGPALRRRIRPLMTGVGTVESALATGAALALLQGARRLPAAVVSLGSAGSRQLPQGSVWQVRSVGYRDMDASPLGIARGVTPFLNLPAAVPLPWQVPGLSGATLSTGAGIVSGAAYDSIEAQMVDMESWAVMRACMDFGVPMIGLRGISDGAEPLGGMLDWTRYLHLIDERLAEALDLVEAAVAGGLLDAVSWPGGVR